MVLVVLVLLLLIWWDIFVGNLCMCWPHSVSSTCCRRTHLIFGWLLCMVVFAFILEAYPPEFQYEKGIRRRKKSDAVLTMMMAADLCWLSVLNAIQSNASNNEYVASVVKLRASKNVSTKGTVPIVQSQHKSHGNTSNQKFTDVK